MDYTPSIPFLISSLLILVPPTRDVRREESRQRGFNKMRHPRLSAINLKWSRINKAPQQHKFCCSPTTAVFYWFRYVITWCNSQRSAMWQGRLSCRWLTELQINETACKCKDPVVCGVVVSPGIVKVSCVLCLLHSDGKIASVHPRVLLLSPLSLRGMLGMKASFSVVSSDGFWSHRQEDREDDEAPNREMRKA